MQKTQDSIELDELLGRVGAERRHLIAILLAIQERHRHLPPALLQALAARLGMAEAEITGVATFYGQFRLRPAGRHRIRVCDGTACHVQRAPIILDALRRHLQLGPAEDTDARGQFTLETVACLGCCTLAPVVQIDDTTYGHLAPERVGALLASVLAAAAAPAGGAPLTTRVVEDGAGEVRIGLGSCCVAKGSQALFDAVAAAVARAGGPVQLKRVGCLGACYQAPVVEVLLPGQLPVRYVGLQPADVPAVIGRHFPARGVVRRLRQLGALWLDRWLTGSEDAVEACGLDPTAPATAEFLTRQVRLATQGGGALDPLDLPEYLANGGFVALQQARAQPPEAVIAAIEQSGLRGRGGGGFPTGRKWRVVQEAAGAIKYVVCNGDEGDPGAFMDRMLLESHPYRVLEGLLLAAWAVGAAEAIVYIRHEYPLAVARVREALRRMQAHGLLEVVAGVPMHVQVEEGAGAFVCGEETALLASLEGRRGTPRLRPPFPGVCGLHAGPTLVNNVETLALVPGIVAQGPAAFRRYGTGESRGTKVFALAGRVVRGGLIEVPMGLTVREIVIEVGGGVPEGRALKAVQIGGPSGGCLPAALLDTPVAYETLLAAGSMMGSGGLVVLDETDCMVEMARYFVSFTQRESCGKCTACRVGTRRMLDILERLCAGLGRTEDLAALEQLAEQVRGGSLCGLGRTAPNPVLTTLRYFREEYAAHVTGHCPAAKCPALIRYTVTETCTGCTRCAQACPVEAIAFQPHTRHIVDQQKCIRCDACRRVCPVQAITVQ
jgi:NADH-quinone oxidoreductase subunit F